MYKTPRTAIKHILSGADFSKKIFDEMRDNQVVALCAIKYNQKNYEFVSERLKSDAEILVAIGKTPVAKPEVLVQVETKKPEPEVLIQVETIKPVATQPVAPSPVQQEIKLETVKQEPKVTITPKPAYVQVPKNEPKPETGMIGFLKKLFGAK